MEGISQQWYARLNFRNKVIQLLSEARKLQAPLRDSTWKNVKDKDEEEKIEYIEIKVKNIRVAVSHTKC